jgi:hypothetical protein
MHPGAYFCVLSPAPRASLLHGDAPRQGLSDYSSFSFVYQLCMFLAGGTFLSDLLFNKVL